MQQAEKRRIIDQQGSNQKAKEKSNYLGGIGIVCNGRIGMDTIIPILISVILVGTENIIRPEIERFGARVWSASRRPRRCHSYLRFVEREWKLGIEKINVYFYIGRAREEGERKEEKKREKARFA